MGDASKSGLINRVKRRELGYKFYLWYVSIFVYSTLVKVGVAESLAQVKKNVGRTPPPGKR